MNAQGVVIVGGIIFLFFVVLLTEKRRKTGHNQDRVNYEQAGYEFETGRRNARYDDRRYKPWRYNKFSTGLEPGPVMRGLLRK